jgi:hypothetical protein
MVRMRCNFDRLHTQRFFYQNYLSCVVPLDGVPQELEEIAQENPGERPPGMPLPEPEGRKEKGDRQANGMEQPVGRMAMPGGVIPQKTHEHVNVSQAGMVLRMSSSFVPDFGYRKQPEQSFFSMPAQLTERLLTLHSA